MASFPEALPEYMTSVSGSPGTRFGVLSGGVSRIYDRDVGVARELSVSLVSRPGSVHSGPSQSTAPRLALQQTSSLKVGTPPPPNPSGIPLGRRAVPFVCVCVCVCVCWVGVGSPPTGSAPFQATAHPPHTHTEPRKRALSSRMTFFGGAADRGQIGHTP